MPVVVSLAALAWVRLRRYAIWALCGAASVFALWTIDGYLVQLSPHWSQKNLHVIYHRARKGPEERLIAWQLNWRGENFYSKNQVVVHMQPKDTPKFKAYLRRHKGERHYLIMEQGRLGTLKGILKGVGAEGTLELVGPGGQAWPDNWVPHYRSERVKMLYREKPKLSSRCRSWKAKLQGRSVPTGASRWRGTGMGDTWWGGHCHKFVKAGYDAWRRRCRGANAAKAPAGCDKEKRKLAKERTFCRKVRRALGPYPYRECFDWYPHNKFMLVRFTP